MPLRVAAPAKLNLTLHITGRRSDGYHLLDSLMAFTDFGDVLDIAPDDALRFDVAGPLAGALGGGDNLVLRAARALQRAAGMTSGAHITLHKYIPVGAGLGGGSADAAAALRALRTLWQLDMDDAALRVLALPLGSDVPVCIGSQAAWVGGIGEKITPVVLPKGVWAVLVNPGVPLLTADVYRGFSGAFDTPSALPVLATADDVIAYLAARHNALEALAAKLLPVIHEMLAGLRATSGCRLSRMSGSGATCFALYTDEIVARDAAKALATAHPAWWIMATEIRNRDETQ